MQTFNPISASDILAWDAGPVPWLWDKFIPRGSLFLLAGFTKVGKSTITYPLAVSISQGRPFLGFDTVKSGVLILAVEEQWRDVQARLKRFNMRADDLLSVHCGLLKNDPQTLELIKNYILHQQISLTLVDTLSMFWSVRDENDNAQVIQQAKPLLDLARSTQCAIGLVTHTSKGGGDQGRSIRGASSLLGIVDQALILEMRQGGGKNQRILKTLGRYSETPPELLIELKGDQWWCLGTGAEAYQEDQLEHLIGCLTKQPQPVTWIVTASELSEKQVRKSLGLLMERGEILKSGSGRKGNPYLFQLK